MIPKKHRRCIEIVEFGSTAVCDSECRTRVFSSGAGGLVPNAPVVRSRDLSQVGGHFTGSNRVVRGHERSCVLWDGTDVASMVGPVVHWVV